MEEVGLLDRIEPHTHMVPHGDRGGVPIEPFLTDQWYVMPPRWPSRQSKACARAAQFRAEELGKDLFRLDGEHPALVHLAAVVVGPPDPGLVRAGRGRCSSRRTRKPRSKLPIQHYIAHEGPWKAWVEEKLENFNPGEILTRDRGCSRHLVLLGAVAVLDARLARQDAGTCALLPDRRAGDRLRHHLLWVARMMMGLHSWRRAVSHGSMLHALVRDKDGAKMSKSKGKCHRPAGTDRRIWRRCAQVHAGDHGGSGPRS